MKHHYRFSAPRCTEFPIVQILGDGWYDALLVHAIVMADLQRLFDLAALEWWRNP